MKNTPHAEMVPSNPNSPFTSTEISEMTQALDTMIQLVESKAPVTNTNMRYRRSLTDRNIGIISQAVQLADSYPDTVSKAINVTE